MHAPISVFTSIAGIDVYKPTELYSDNKSRVVQFYLANEKNVTLPNANWIVNFTNSLINSSQLISIPENETILVIVENNYTNGGDYKINVTGSYENFDFEDFNIKFGVRALSLNVASKNISNVTFNLLIFWCVFLSSQVSNLRRPSSNEGLPFFMY